ncbi:MAG: cation:proton antiporter, partial [Planctomycetota bacterium]
MIQYYISAAVEHVDGPNMALVFGLIIFLGTFGSRLFQKLHIPQVVGCIVVGIMLGEIFNLITGDMIENLKPFTMFALGLIGFMIGGELRGDVFKKYGRQFFVILLSQGVSAFVLVAVTTSVIMWFIVADVYTSIAAGLVLGAIASATAPAATANVLWEFKTRGPLTAAILAVVALDDGLALLLYRAAVSGAQVLLGNGDSSILNTVLILFGEILGSVLLGFAMGVLLFYLLKFVKAEDKVLGFSIASLLLVVGVSMTFEIDPILPTMTLGITIANMLPRQSKGLFELVHKSTPPIYTTFFVLAGAHMEFGMLTVWIVIMIIVYTIFRATGKIWGSWFGARYSNAPASVRKYLGLCLLPQAGVAIGLAILSRQQFGPELGRTIILVVMTATFIMEILGPMMVKVGVKRAGEVGMNVTEQELIDIYTVEDIMETEPTKI